MMKRKYPAIILCISMLAVMGWKESGNSSKQINFSGAFALYPLKKPANQMIPDCFKWVLTEGQQFIKNTGYLPLPDNIIKEQLKKLE